jgi:peroxiredoxin
MTSPTPTRKRPPLALLLGLGAAIIVAVGIIVSLNGSSDNDTALTTVADGSPVINDISYGSPVITGDPLPEMVAAAPGSPDAAVGLPVPTISGQNLANESSSQPSGKPYVLVFLAHWCPHCNNEADRLRDEINSGLNPDGRIIAVLTGSTDQRENWPPGQWLGSKGLRELPTIVDDQQGTISRAFGLSSFPLVVSVGADGKVISRASGEQAPGFFASLLGAASVPS